MADDTQRPASRMPFYGWTLVVVAFLCYGFGIGPSSFGWTVLTPALVEELDLTRTEVSTVRALRALLVSLMGPFVGLSLSRWGIRAVMTVGIVVSTVGMFYMSRVETLLDCYLAFGLLGGLGVGFSMLIPNQSLVANWFERYRARAMAVVLTSAGLVGGLFSPLLGAMSERGAWREGWVLMAAISAGVGVLVILFVRNRPEDIGQLPDGREGDAGPGRPDRLVQMATGISFALATSVTALVSHWRGPSVRPASREPAPMPAGLRELTVRRVLRSPQFALLVCTGIGYAVPWQVVLVHGGLHLGDMGLDATVAGGIIGTTALSSILGRLSGALGDYFGAKRVLAVGLLLNAISMLGMALATRADIALFAYLLIGLGFGAAYISTPVVFAEFFGRRSFATATGIRYLIGGLFTTLVPIAAGYLFDRYATYRPTFLALALYCLLASVIAFGLRPPQSAADEA